MMRTVFVYLTLLVMTVVLGLTAIVASLLGIRQTPGNFLGRIPRLFARSALRAAGATVRVNNPERIGHGEARVYASNHVSWFDVFALASVLPHYRFVAKKELQRIPLFGQAAGLVAAIYIDRRNRKAAFDAYADAAAQVRGGVGVIVYPEGTRGRSYELRPFKKGPFVLAIAAQVPVVPVVIHGAREIQPKGAVRVRPGTVEVTFLEPVETVGLTYDDRDALMRTVWARMAAELERRYGIRSAGAAIDTEPSKA
jgi:1-acyl-sn-glycerol-3-phosphate acyltransferase